MFGSSSQDGLHDRHGSPKNTSPTSHQRWDLTLAISSIPFILTFIIVGTFAWRTLFPLLSGQSTATRSHHDPSSIRRISLRPSRFPLILKTFLLSTLDRLPAITFSTTIGLSAVLAELIFCEISNLLNPAARRSALETTISILLVSLVIVTPALEIHSITSAASWKLSGLKRGAKYFAWTLDVVGLIAWLAAFWWIGRAALGSSHTSHKSKSTGTKENHGFSAGSLERIGIIGISLMASLAGFAAVSSLWQTFGGRNTRRVTETDISRKQAGLDATTDLLQAKETRLRTLERKLGMPSPQKEAFFSRVMGSIRGNPETAELSSLKLEISGLEAMHMSLSNSVRLLHSRRDAQLQASRPIGKLFIAMSYIFSLYCLYRIAATSVATSRRWWRRHADRASFATTTDPINNVLALVAKHWDPSLDRAAWSRQISFLLSGLMLLASFNAVLQTVLLFSRFTPHRLLHSAQQNLALLVSQISATYVVSSALLLRSNLPKEMGSVIEGALGAPLDAGFVESWFEGWFLGACGITAVGIWVGRKVLGGKNGDGMLDDEIGEEGVAEMGKRLQ